jgi:hypothetical protein
VRNTSSWANVSDDRLIDLDLEIDNPEALEDLVRQVPANYADAHVEFKYDLRGIDVTEFTCVHGSHQHKADFVMNVDGVRFMVGWQCAKTIYNEDFDKYTADFDAAVGRRDALPRVREIRDAITQFSAWLDHVSSSNALQAFSTVATTSGNICLGCSARCKLRTAGGLRTSYLQPRDYHVAPKAVEWQLVRLPAKKDRRRANKSLLIANQPVSVPRTRKQHDRLFRKIMIDVNFIRASEILMNGLDGADKAAQGGYDPIASGLPRTAICGRPFLTEHADHN